MPRHGQWQRRRRYKNYAGSSMIFCTRRRLIEMVCPVGLLIWISRITQSRLADYYGPLKFFRRRASQNCSLTAPLRVWPCIINDLNTWISKAISNPPRIIKSFEDEDQAEAIAFTDASNVGYGVVIFLPTQTYILAEHWNTNRVTWHINRKEAFAVEICLNKIERIVQM